MSDETPRALLERAFIAGFQCCRDCGDYGDNHGHFRDEQRERVMAAHLDALVAPSLPPTEKEFCRVCKTTTPCACAGHDIDSDPLPGTAGLPPTVEEARANPTLYQARYALEFLIEDATHAGDDESWREPIARAVNALLAAQRHASAQEIERLTEWLRIREKQVNDAAILIDQFTRQAQAQLTGWQPIATAPVVEGFMGEPINALVYGPHLGVHRGRVARYADGLLYAGVSHINGNSADIITHWQPLPKSPEGKE